MQTANKIKFTAAERRELLKAAKEPKIEIINYRTSLINALNFYNVDLERKTKVKYVREFAEQRGIDLSKAHDQFIAMYGGICRLILRDEPIEQTDIDKTVKTLKDLAYTATIAYNDVISEEEPVAVAPKKTPEEIAQERATELIEEFEQAIDETLKKQGAVEFDIKQLLSRAQNPRVFKIVQEHIQKVSEEFQEVSVSDNDQIQEGYSNIPKRKMNHLVKWLTSGEQIAKVQAVVQKAVRKPRKVKAKPAGVIVRGLKYMKTYGGIDSCNPETILGSTMVILYNTKHRKIIILQAAEGTTLTVKGTSILNIDPTKSFSKTLRKPDEQLKDFINASKRNAITSFKGIKATERVPNGRVNEEMLICSVNK
ncbi:hypothetical protein [Synechococcus phage BUCT-ZZ01]|nr:hypothetical protein [Synechococcus phage BUCT-ZZ01]